MTPLDDTPADALAEPCGGCGAQPTEPHDAGCAIEVMDATPRPEDVVLLARLPVVTVARMHRDGSPTATAALRRIAADPARTEDDRTCAHLALGQPRGTLGRVRA